jgi:ribonuclease HII
MPDAKLQMELKTFVVSVHIYCYAKPTASVICSDAAHEDDICTSKTLNKKKRSAILLLINSRTIHCSIISIRAPNNMISSVHLAASLGR